MHLFGTKRHKFHHCPGTKGQQDKGRYKMGPSIKGRSKTGKGCSKAGKDVLKQEIWSLFFGIFKFILSRDVLGQRSLSRENCSCPCPGTKGHRDKIFFLPQDKGTTGRLVPVCPRTSRPVETLV